jgi:hypothetical protein
MKFEKITVSGITNIVINRKVKWIYSCGMWNEKRPHTEMMAIVNHLKADKRYRMWIHGNTLNIVKVNEK